MKRKVVVVEEVSIEEIFISTCDKEKGYEIDLTYISKSGFLLDIFPHHMNVQLWKLLITDNLKKIDIKTVVIISQNYMFSHYYKFYIIYFWPTVIYMKLSTVLSLLLDCKHMK